MLLARIIDRNILGSLIPFASYHHVFQRYEKRPKFHKNIFPIKNSASVAKGGPKAPDFETVAYKPLPEHLHVDVWQKNGDPTRKSPVLYYTKWSQQRDARLRAVSTYYGPIRLRLMALQFNGFLPLEAKQLADSDISHLPRESDKNKVINRCVMTSRARGKKVRWRISRFRHRHMADHGQMSGTFRAVW